MREDLAIRRERHPLVLRQAPVTAIADVTPILRRITFCGPALQGFVSGSFDDHVKVFFPEDGAALPRMPQLDADGQPVKTATGPRPVARDYTPRRFDPVAGVLEIEFLLHGEGPGTQWAAQARIGQVLGFGGPRGSLVIPTGFDWHWLIGDGTALPAIARRLEELPAGSRADVVLMLDAPDALPPLDSAAERVLHPVRGVHHTGNDSPLHALLASLPLPPGEGFVWVAGELATVRAIRQTLLARGIDKTRIRASSYWQQGETASHQQIGD